MAADVARRAVGSVCVWHLRVLAGWLPPHGGDVVRVFAGPFELANVADRLAGLGGAQVPEPYALGALGAAWSRVVAASTPEQVRSALAGSGWGDPGTVELARRAGPPGGPLVELAGGRGSRCGDVGGRGGGTGGGPPDRR